MYENLVIFAKLWWNSGFKKSQNAVDFSTFDL
jgi:hypothetical protein